MNLLYEENNHTANTEEVRATLEPLKAFFTEIIVIEYGMNRDELMHSFENMQIINKYINNGDKIYIDITHSFRSLAMYELVAVKYLKEACGKRISIEAVSYGMLEVTK